MGVLYFRRFDNASELGRPWVSHNLGHFHGNKIQIGADMGVLYFRRFDNAILGLTKLFKKNINKGGCLVLYYYPFDIAKKSVYSPHGCEVFLVPAKRQNSRNIFNIKSAIHHIVFLSESSCVLHLEMEIREENNTN